MTCFHKGKQKERDIRSCNAARHVAQACTLPHVPSINHKPSWLAQPWFRHISTLPLRKQQEGTQAETMDTASNNRTGIQSLEDYEAIYPPRPRMVPVSARRQQSSGEAATKFKGLCDRHGVKPVFSFEETEPQSFLAKVQIGSESFQLPEPRPGKREAKEELCKLAIPHIPAIEKMEGNKKSRASKRKPSEPDRFDAGRAPFPTSKVDQSENWIGILNGKCSCFDAILPRVSKALDPSVVSDTKPASNHLTLQTTLRSRKSPALTSKRHAQKPSLFILDVASLLRIFQMFRCNSDHSSVHSPTKSLLAQQLLEKLFYGSARRTNL